MTSLVINLPLPPSANRLWRIANRRIIRSPEYKLWIAHASWAVKAERKTAKITGPFTLRLAVGKASKGRRDLDNRIKPALDALVHGGAVEDDSLCQWIEARWDPEIIGIRALVMATQEPA